MSNTAGAPGAIKEEEGTVEVDGGEGQTGAGIDEDEDDDEDEEVEEEVEAVSERRQFFC